MVDRSEALLGGLGDIVCRMSGALADCFVY